MVGYTGACRGRLVEGGGARRASLVGDTRYVGKHWLALRRREKRRGEDPTHASRTSYMHVRYVVMRVCIRARARTGIYARLTRYMHARVCTRARAYICISRCTARRCMRPCINTRAYVRRRIARTHACVGRGSAGRGLAGGRLGASKYGTVSAVHS